MLQANQFFQRTAFFRKLLFNKANNHCGFPSLFSQQMQQVFNEGRASVRFVQNIAMNYVMCPFNIFINSINNAVGSFLSFQPLLITNV